MSTIERAMALLDFFAADRPEIGLSELRALAGRDKATTYRHLCALESAGLVEQNPVTRRYRIGPAVLRLAHLRELATPRRASVLQALPGLAEATGETAHASILEGSELRTLDYYASKQHSTRVVISDEVLPLHATGSGLAVLAFGPPALLNAARRRLRRFTDHTAADAATLDAALAAARGSGFGVSHQGYEAGVHGVAVPLFDDRGGVAGALAVACVVARVTAELETRIRRELVAAARVITASWGGRIPQALEQAWAQSAAAPPVRRASAKQRARG